MDEPQGQRTTAASRTAATLVGGDSLAWTVVPPTPAPSPSAIAPSQGTQTTMGIPEKLAQAVGGRLGPYDILEVVARGGQGVVYRANHRELGTQVALKLLLQHMDAHSVQRFRQEAQVLARMRHPNLIVVTDLGEMMGVPFLAMDFVRGADLKTIVDTKGPLAFDDARSVLEPIARTLHYCHERGLVHRDVKPQNILIEEKTQRPLLIDFGLLKRAEHFEKEFSGVASASVAQSEIGGTPSFMAPEQTGAPGFGTAGPRSDVYGLGSTLYYLVTGKPPFKGEKTLDTLRMVQLEPPVDPRVHRPDCPAPIAELCLQAMSKRQEDRPLSAGAFADVLRPRAPAEGDAAFYQARGRQRRSEGDLVGALSDLARAMEMLPPGDPLERELHQERVSIEAELARRGGPSGLVKVAAAIAFVALAGGLAFALTRPSGPKIDYSKKTPPELALASVPEWDGGPLAVSCTVRDSQPKCVRWQLVVDGKPAGTPFEAAIGPSGRVDAVLDPASVTSSTPATLAVIAVAEDLAGNTSRAEAIVAISRDPPSISIESPREGLVTNARSIPLRAIVGSRRLRDAVALLKVGDAERARIALANGAGNAVSGAAVPLPESDGPCAIEVTTRDLVGNVGRSSVSLRVDRTPPEVVVLAPTGEPVTREDEARVRVKVTDASAVTATLEGRALSPEGDGAFSGTFRLTREGRNEGRLVARDEAGNEVMRTIVVVRDRTPPRLLEVKREPGEPEVTAERVTITIVTDKPCQAVIAGTAAVESEDRKTHRTALALPLGKTKVTVVLTDALGNTATLEPKELEVERVVAAVLRPAWWTLAPAQRDYALEHGTVVAFENALGMRFALVPPGTFRMGSPETENGHESEEFAHDVVITRAYYVSATEVTNALFRRFQPEHRSGKFKDMDLDGDDQPVVNVSLADAQAFCRWLDKQANGDGIYRLPTEAEWERGYRAGSDAAFFWGAAAADGAPHANGAGLEALAVAGLEERDAFPFRDKWPATAPVGSLKPNAFGLDDMAGNVAEWVSDRYASYPSDLVRDPVGPASGKYAIARGGSFAEGPVHCRAAFRQALADGTYPTVGFRVVATVAMPKR